MKVLASVTESESGIPDLARRAKIEVEMISGDELTALGNSGSHQGYAALVTERRHLELKEFLSRTEQFPRSLVAIVDSIHDPQNLGTILRAGECFGIDAIVWSKNRGAGITPVVTKTSVGASELIHSIPVSNLSEAVRKLKDAGYWIVAADAGDQAISISEFEFPERCAIVFGSEGEGIQRLLLENCDYVVSIPLSGVIDSLNVSQAVSVFLYKYRERHPGKSLLATS